MKRYLIIGGAGLLLAIIAFSVFSLVSDWRGPKACGCALPPPDVWKVQSEQLAVEDEQGLFAIKEMDFSSERFRFFYVFHSSQFNEPEVQVVAQRDKDTVIDIETVTQSLGILGEYNVGVITTEHLDYNGQELTLQIKLPGSDEPTWELEGIQQVIAEEEYGPVLGGAYFASVEPSDVMYQSKTIYDPDQPQTLGYFALITPSGQPAQYLFLDIEANGEVKVISRGEYEADAGPVTE